jgi:hypothetical protein
VVNRFWLLPRTLPDIVSVDKAIAAIVIERFYYCVNYKTSRTICSRID